MDTARQIIHNGLDISRYVVKNSEGWITWTGHSSYTFDQDFENAQTFNRLHEAQRAADLSGGKIHIMYKHGNTFTTEIYIP